MRQLVQDFGLWLKDNPVAAVVAFAISVISIAFGYLLHRASIKRRRIVYAIRTTSLFSEINAIDDHIEVTRQGTALTTLAVSRVALWNRGKDSVREADIASSDPLRISSKPEVTVLSIKMLQVSREVCRPRIHIDHELNAWIVRPEFFDHNDGVVLSVLHTGSHSDDLLIQGTIVGGDPIFGYHPRRGAKLFKVARGVLRNPRREMWFLAFAAIAIFFGTLFYHAFWTNFDVDRRTKLDATSSPVASDMVVTTIAKDGEAVEYVLKPYGQLKIWGYAILSCAPYLVLALVVKRRIVPIPLSKYHQD